MPPFLAPFRLALDESADRLGRKTRFALQEIFTIARFAGRTFFLLPRLFRNGRLTLDQMSIIGITSLPLVVLTSVFTGAVTAWQAGYQFADYVPLSYVGVAVGKSILVQLGPVLTALVVAGRIGAAMAAELGTMRVTEQIDAMECLCLDPYQFLYAPRLYAALVMMPVLTIISSFTGILGALGVAMIPPLSLDAAIFFNGVKLFFYTQDVVIGVSKAVLFGGIIAIVGCYMGSTTTGGAEGVGKSTRTAVVVSTVSILISCYLVDVIFL
jgi:phospholipid/cholesterol/gamma-HCH transport system permease protein